MSLPPTIFNVDLSDWPKPLAKLIETVAKGLGIVYEPTRIRRKASAEADALRIRGKAEADYLRMMTETEDDLLTSRVQKALELQKEYFDTTEELAGWRASQRLRNREMRRQYNLESIVGQAAQQLPDIVAEEPVDDDWIAQFFNYSQDVGNEELQAVWASLLAGEVANPGTYSLRTLHTVRMLKQGDARLFRTLSNYLWSGFHCFYEPDLNDYLKEKGLGYAELLHLESIGVIVMRQGLKPSLHSQERGYLDVKYIDTTYRLMPATVDEDGPAKLSSLRCHTVTAVGEELYSLTSPTPDHEYVQLLLDLWRERGFMIRKVDDSGQSDVGRHETRS